MLRHSGLLLLLLMVGSLAQAQQTQPASPKKEEKKKAWYEKFSIRGYTQLRFNQTLTESAGEAQHVGDASIGEDQSFFIRRARLVLSGEVSPHLSLYIQPDFTVTPPGSPDVTFFAQLRDWYADLYFDTQQVFRLRVGQSKLPYGWENMQSSGNRLPLDRNDALNSPVKNERDLGLLFYWTPLSVQRIFERIAKEGLKGSGNYGAAAFGVYNGQGGSLLEKNDNLHVIARFTWPFALKNGQILEAGVQAYSGKYVALSSAISPLGVGATARPAGTLENGGADGLLDQRLAGSFVYYPQPLGFQAEWTIGRGPTLNEAQTEVSVAPLSGGYAMAMYRIKLENGGELFPFYRWSLYDGGYKTERNAPRVHINEQEMGVEWQINKQLEVVTMYTNTDRTNTRAVGTADARSYEQFRGSLLRFQLQINY